MHFASDIPFTRAVNILAALAEPVYISTSSRLEMTWCSTLKVVHPIMHKKMQCCQGLHMRAEQSPLMRAEEPTTAPEVTVSMGQ